MNKSNYCDHALVRARDTKFSVKRVLVCTRSCTRRSRAESPRGIYRKRISRFRKRGHRFFRLLWVEQLKQLRTRCGFRSDRSNRNRSDESGVKVKKDFYYQRKARAVRFFNYLAPGPAHVRVGYKRNIIIRDSNPSPQSSELTHNPFSSAYYNTFIAIIDYLSI